MAVIDYIRDYVVIDGTRFFWKSNEEAYAKKLDIQNIPKTDVPVVQYLGEANKYITLSLETAGKLPNQKNSYQSQKEWLRTFLGTRKGLDITVTLPDAKSYRCILMEGRLSESNTSTNVISFNVKFLILNVVVEKVTIPNKSALNDKVGKAKKTLGDRISKFIPEVVKDKYGDIVELMKKNGITKQNASRMFNKFKKSYQATNSFINRTQSKISTLVGIKDRIIATGQRPSQWVSQLLSINESVRELANSPSQLYGILIGTISRIGLYFGDTKSTLDAVSSAFDFTKSSPSNPNNMETFYKKADEDGVRNVINASVLLTSYDIASNIEYSNTEDINAVQKTLNEMYDSLVADPIFDDQTKIDIQDARIEMDKFLNTTRLNVNTVILVNITRPKPFDNIIFDRYGNLDLYDELVALNIDTLTDTIHVTGDIKLYAEQN